MHIILSSFQSLLAGFVILSILVFVHELGHFLVAKAFKIKVLAFSLGFGKAFFSKTINGTEYRFSMIPFGGYVRMAGEYPQDGVPLESSDFNAKPIWQRAGVVLAGPVFNYVFAFILAWCVFMIGIERPRYLDTPSIGAVLDSSIAQHAGFLSGDTLISINGKHIANWHDIEKSLTFQERTYHIVAKRGTQELPLTLQFPPITSGGIPKNPTGGILPAPPAIIGATTPGMPGAVAGLQKGDIVTAINGKKVNSWHELSQSITQWDSTKGPLACDIQRSTSTLTLTINPAFNTTEKRYMLGIAMETPAMRKISYSPLVALPLAVQKTWDLTTMIFVVVKKLVTKEVSANQLAGPVGIVQMSGAMVSFGIVSVLTFMALLGVNLAVINLLPLVITDGGVLLLLLVEAIRKRPLSLNAQMIINRIAIAGFIALAIFVTFNDIKRIPEMFQMFGK